MTTNLNRTRNLSWQSRVLLAAVVLCVSASLVLTCLEFRWAAPMLLRHLLTGAAIAAAFGLLVWLLRAGTAGAALTGALFTVSLYLAAPGWRTLLWPLLALFLLTFAATRFGRARKEKLHLAEDRHGRSAAQVAANLGAAALASIPLAVSHAFAIGIPMFHRDMIYPCIQVALVAALAEATADTLASELGEVLGGEPFMMTTGRRVPAGTDGAISLAGTLAGAAGAAVIALVAAAVLPLSWKEGFAALASGLIGLFVDSLLGATLERQGWLNNDAVNCLSTCAAAGFGVLLAAAL